MNKTELMKNAQTTLGQIFTKKRLKKAGAGILICGILAAGAGWYHHQQKQAEHASILAARTTMIEAQASQNNVALLDTDSIRSLAAQAIGLDENTITFREVALSDASQQADSEKEKKGHGDKKHADKKSDKEQTVPTDSKDYENLAAKQTEAPAPIFRPIYKVSCKANNVKYNLHIDAVTGTVLHSNIEKK